MRVLQSPDRVRLRASERTPADDCTPLAALVLAAVGLVAAAGARAGLAWDGAYYLLSALHRQTPFVAHDRLLPVLPQWPVVWLTRVTDDLGVLAVAFSAFYALMPLVALACSWAVARWTRPDLFVWAALGILLVTLPGQFFLVSEAVLAVQLAWPVLLWAAAGAPRRGLPLIAALVAAVVAAHPFATPLLALAAALALLRSRDRRHLTVAAVLAMVATARLVLIAETGYETRSATVEVVITHFGSAVTGLPLVALAAACVAGVALLARRGRLAAAAIIAAGAALLVWAATPGRWANALDYRTWSLFTAVPFVMLLALDASRGPSEDRWARAVVTMTAAVTFAGVLTIQSVQWSAALSRFAQTVHAADAPCLTQVAGIDDTPLRHWGRRATSVLVQGRTPSTVLLSERDCATLAPGAPLPLAPYEATPRPGWFDLTLE